MKIGDYEMLEDLHYEPHHMWAKVDGDVVIVGVDDFGQSNLGEVVYIEMPMEGDEVSQKDAVASIESGKSVERIYAPVSGEIVEINESLEDDPTVVNTDPYDEGWLFKIKPSDLSELENLIHGAEAIQKWIEEEIKRLS